MAADSLISRIQLIIDSGKSSAELRRLQSSLKSLQSTLNSLSTVRLASLNTDLAALGAKLAAAKSVNLAPLNTQLAGFKAQLLAANTAGAGFRNTIAGISNANSAIRKLDIGNLNNQIKDVKRNLADDRVFKLTKFQNSLRSANEALIDNNIRIRNIKRSLDVINKNGGVGKDVAQAALDKATSRIPELKNNIDKARIALSQETTAQAQNTLQATRNIQARQQQIKQFQQSITANERTIQQLKARALLEQQNATQARNNIGLTQAQIAAQQQAARASQDAIRQQIAAKQQEIASARQVIATRRNELSSTSQLARAEADRITATQGIAKAGRQFSLLGGIVSRQTGAVREFGAALKFALGPQVAGFAAGGAILAMVHGFFKANIEIENLRRGLNAISDFGGLQFAELTRIANATGQSIVSVSNSFLQLTASAKGTNLEGEATRRIFEAVSNALVVTGADTVRSQRAFLALAQMMSKGQVYAEELRQQLSEALPGSVNIFARALGVAPSKMLELMKQGKISADSLILFANELEKTYKKLTPEMFTFSQKANLLGNSLLNLFENIGNTGVWRVLSNGLLTLKDYVDDAAASVGYLSDKTQASYRYLYELSNITGLSGLFNSFISGIKSSLSELFDYIEELSNSIPKTLANSLVEVNSLISQVDARNANISVGANTEKAQADLQRLFSWINEHDFNLSDINLSGFFSGLIQDSAFKELNRVEELLRSIRKEGVLTEEEFKNFSFLNKLPGVSQLYAGSSTKAGIGDYQQYLDSVKKTEAAVNSLIDKEKERISNIQSIADQEKKDKQAIEDADKARQAEVQSAARIRDLMAQTGVVMTDLQRAAEKRLNAQKTNEKSILGEISLRKKVVDLENQIADAVLEGRRASEDAAATRIKDAREVLSIELQRDEAILRARANAEAISKARLESGGARTTEDEQASKAANAAYVNERKAVEALESAVKAKSYAEQAAFRETAKMYYEKAAQQRVDAGQEYQAKKNYEELAKIAAQNSETNKDAVKNTDAQTKAEERYARAIEYVKSAQSSAGDVAEKYRAQAAEQAKLAQDLLKGVGTEAAQQRLADINRVLTELSKQEVSVNTDLQGQINKTLEDIQRNYDPTVIPRQLANLDKLLRELEAERAKLIQEGVSAAARKTLDDQIEVLNQQLQRLKDKLQEQDNKITLPAQIGDPDKDEVKNLSDQIQKQADLIPITFPAKANTDNLESELKDSTKGLGIKVNANTSLAEESLNAFKEYIESKTISLPVNIIYNDPGFTPYRSSGGPTPGFHLGTVLPGYGGGDRIHALLEPGEAILRKEVVRRLGPDWINQQNASVNSASMAVTHAVSSMPRFAGGGIAQSNIVINVPGQQSIKVSGSRDQAKALADLLGRAARSL